MPIAARRTRDQRRALTRDALVAVARRTFLRRGFHASSLEEIALEAGFTKGAVYSNFTSKAELFLAVLDEHVEERLRAYAAAAVPAQGVEALARSQARLMLALEARWVGLMAEVWTHAADDSAFRAALAERQDRMLDGLGGLLQRIAEAGGLEFVLPAREVARAGGALGRGLLLERALGRRRLSDEQFEATWAAFVRGLTRPADRERRRRRRIPRRKA